MEIEPVIGQRIAGVIGGICAKSFRNHEDVARQLESIAAMARTVHAQQKATGNLTEPLPMPEENSLEG